MSPLPKAVSQVDVWQLARKGETLQGVFALSGCARLLEGMAAQPVDRVVEWSLAGQTGSLGQQWLTLQAHAQVTLQCQRCLSQFDLQLRVDTRVQLVSNEEELEADGADEDPDTPDRLLGSTHFDVHALVEDELILALPYVPKHEVCPSLPKALVEAHGTDTRRASPFAVLADLKKD